MKKIILVCMILFSVGLISYAEPVSAQSNPIDIVQNTEPQNATQQQFETVQTWFFENGDSLTESEQNQVGSWVTSYQSGESSSSGSSSGESEQSNAPETVQFDVNDNIQVVDYEYNSEGVSITLYAQNSTEQVALTDPPEDTEKGHGSVAQRGVTVPRQQQVTTEFKGADGVIWISTGIEETKYISNGSGSIVDTLSWSMIPTAALATALSIFTIAIVYVRRINKKAKGSYTNVFKKGGEL